MEKRIDLPALIKACNFKDFVIEVFDMRITKGHVKIHIELGA